MQQNLRASYNPNVFDVGSIAEARSIILTPEGGRTTDERWHTETPYLRNLICSQLQITHKSLVLDYGCGIGRLAKELINFTGCRVIGADISPNMRVLAEYDIKGDRFAAVHPEFLRKLIANGLRFDFAISVWTLQHCLEPKLDLELIARGFQDRDYGGIGGLFVVNQVHRCVPVNPNNGHGMWVNDGINIRNVIEKTSFLEENSGVLDPDSVGSALAESCFWATYRAV